MDGHRIYDHEEPCVKSLVKKEDRVSGLGAFVTRLTVRHRAEEKTELKMEEMIEEGND